MNLPIVEDLKGIWELTDGGDLPVRSEGSRWINHKRKALQRLVDRYGCFLNHLATLSVDQSINSTDRARLKGYLQKWKQPRVLIGAALYVVATETSCSSQLMSTRRKTGHCSRNSAHSCRLASPFVFLRLPGHASCISVKTRSSSFSSVSDPLSSLLAKESQLFVSRKTRNSPQHSDIRPFQLSSHLLFKPLDIS